MEDALWTQLQNTSLEEHDDRNRIEPETDSEQDESDQDDLHGDDSVSFSIFFNPFFPIEKLLFPLLFLLLLNQDSIFSPPN